MTPREPERTATAAELADERAKLDRAASWRSDTCDRRETIAISPLGDAQLICHLNGLHTGPHFDASDKIWWETAAESGADPHIDLPADPAAGMDGPSLTGLARQLVESFDQDQAAALARPDWARLAAAVLREVARG